MEETSGRDTEEGIPLPGRTDVQFLQILPNMCLNSAWWDQFLPDLVCWAEEEEEGELQDGAGELQTSSLFGSASMSKVDNSENNKIKKMF